MEQTHMEWQKLMEYGAYPWWLYPRSALYPFVGIPGFPCPQNEEVKPQGQDSPELPVTDKPSHVEEQQKDVKPHSDTLDRRPVQEKVRHKRQTLQDMSRPLKQWLYAHKDHPYPTKTDKVALARDSNMTLTQVSNWFANARRRLKNTVKGPDMGWGKRIKLYNSCVEGNQELLSISSQDSMWDSEEDGEKDREVQTMDMICGPVKEEEQEEEDIPPQPVNPPQLVNPPPPVNPISPAGDQSNQLLQTEHVYAAAPPVSNTPVCDVTTQSGNVCHSNGHEQPSKFKHSILQRYLNDSYEHSLQVQSSARNGAAGERQRNPSGSLSSHDYEDISVSSRSSPVREHLVLDELSDFEEISRQWPHIEDRAEEDLYWKEISAALALTTLAKSRHKPVSSTE